jgi:membrane protease YdiL (CAAX protease family)
MQSTYVMDRHRHVLGILYVVFSALLAVGALAGFAVLMFGALASSDAEERAEILGVGGVLAGLLLLLSVPGFIGGIGLLKRRAWSKVLTLILAVLNLPGFPVGTALGIYTVWFWLQPNVRPLFFPQESEPRGPELGGPDLRRPLST